MGGGHQRAVWEQQGVHCFYVLNSLKNLTNWSDGRRGGGGPGRRARGGRWEGGTREQCGQQGVHWFHLLGSLKNLTIGLIWLVW